MSLTHILGLLQNSINVQCPVAVVISHEMSHVPVKEHSLRLIQSFVILHKNQQKYKNVEFLIVHLSGWKVNGENVQRHVVKMVRERDKFTVKFLKRMGEFKKKREFLSNEQFLQCCKH